MSPLKGILAHGGKGTSPERQKKPVSHQNQKKEISEGFGQKIHRTEVGGGTQLRGEGNRVSHEGDD